jgi:hypothetical protein
MLWGEQNLRTGRNRWAANSDQSAQSPRPGDDTRGGDGARWEDEAAYSGRYSMCAPIQLTPKADLRCALKLDAFSELPAVVTGKIVALGSTTIGRPVSSRNGERTCSRRIDRSYEREAIALDSTCASGEGTGSSGGGIITRHGLRASTTLNYGDRWNACTLTRRSVIGAGVPLKREGSVVNHKKLFPLSWEDRLAVRRRGGQAAPGSGARAAKGATRPRIRSGPHARLVLDCTPRP